MQRGGVVQCKLVHAQAFNSGAFEVSRFTLEVPYFLCMLSLSMAQHFSAENILQGKQNFVLAHLFHGTAILCPQLSRCQLGRLHALLVPWWYLQRL